MLVTPETVLGQQSGAFFTLIYNTVHQATQLFIVLLKTNKLKKVEDNICNVLVQRPRTTKHSSETLTTCLKKERENETLSVQFARVQRSQCFSHASQKSTVSPQQNVCLALAPNLLYFFSIFYTNYKNKSVSTYKSSASLRSW